MLGDQPIGDHLVGAGVHGGNDDVVGALGVLGIEIGDGRFRGDLRPGVELHRFGPLGYDGDLGNIGSLQHAIGRKEVGELGRLVPGDDGDHRPVSGAGGTHGGNGCGLLIRRYRFGRRWGCGGRARGPEHSPGRRCT